MRALCLAPVLLGAAVPVLAAPAAPPGAAACSGCHGARTATIIPSLQGQAPDEIVAAMQAFRTGARPATVMDRIAKGFTDEEIRAIATWVSQHVEVAMGAMLSRRDFLGGALAASAALMARPSHAQGLTRVIVIGGGFAGATCARELKRSGLAVTLAEPNPIYTSCPFSNEVIAGLRPLEAQRFDTTRCGPRGSP